MAKRRFRPTYAGVAATLALVFALGGTAAAGFIVNSNADIGPGTVSGANPPGGDHANVIAGSLGTSDLHANAVTTAKLKDGAVTKAKLAAPEAWHEIGAANQPAFFTSCPNVNGCHYWHNYGSGASTAAYYKDPFGVVHLKGTVQCVISPPQGDCTPAFFQVIFSLPTGYIPALNEDFAVPSNEAYGQIDVKGLGEGIFAGEVVITVGGPEAYISLDGITFRAGA